MYEYHTNIFNGMNTTLNFGMTPVASYSYHFLYEIQTFFFAVCILKLNHIDTYTYDHSARVMQYCQTGSHWLRLFIDCYMLSKDIISTKY